YDENLNLIDSHEYEHPLNIGIKVNNITYGGSRRYGLLRDNLSIKPDGPSTINLGQLPQYKTKFGLLQVVFKTSFNLFQILMVFIISMVINGFITNLKICSTQETWSILKSIQMISLNFMSQLI